MNKQKEYEKLLEEAKGISHEKDEWWDPKELKNYCGKRLTKVELSWLEYSPAENVPIYKRDTLHGSPLGSFLTVKEDGSISYCGGDEIIYYESKIGYYVRIFKNPSSPQYVLHYKLIGFTKLEIDKSFND